MDRKMNEKSLRAAAPTKLGDEELSTVAGASGPSWLSLFASPVVQTNVSGPIVQVAGVSLGPVTQMAGVAQSNSIG